MRNHHYARADKLQPFLERLQAGEFCLLAALGDSNTCNTNFTHGAKQWIEHLHSELRNHYNTQRVLMINAGVSGNTIIDGLERFDTDIARCQPHCCIVAMGSNDAKKISDDAFRDGLNRCIDQLHALDCIPVIRTSTPILEYEPGPGHIWLGDDKLRDKNDINRSVAEERELAFVDVYAHWEELEASGALNMPSLMHDAVHTNARGHEQVFRSIAPLFGLEGDFPWELE